MKNELPDFDETNIDACKKFIKTAKFGPKKANITHLKQPDGSQLPIDRCPDEQVLETAHNLYEVFSRVK